jgi:diacylglycerol kinase (ATP)
VVVANPVSGAGRAAALVPGLLAALTERGIVARPVWTTPDDRDPAVDAEILDSSLAIAVGGDGTLHRVARPIALSPVPVDQRPVLALLAAGTANVARRALGLPRTAAQLAAAAARLDEGGVDIAPPIDIGIVRRPDSQVEDVMVLWAGAGWDGALIHAVAARRGGVRGWRVLARYFVEAPGAWWRLAFSPLSIELDGRAVEGSSAMVCNLGEIAVGRVTGRARIDDGEFDVVIGRARGRTELLANLTCGLALPLDRLPGFHRVRARNIAFRGGPFPVQIDGEAAGHVPLAVELSPRAVRLLRAPSG